MVPGVSFIANIHAFCNRSQQPLVELALEATSLQFSFPIIQLQGTWCHSPFFTCRLSVCWAAVLRETNIRSFQICQSPVGPLRPESVGAVTDVRGWMPVHSPPASAVNTDVQQPTVRRARGWVPIPFPANIFRFMFEVRFWRSVSRFERLLLFVTSVRLPAQPPCPSDIFLCTCNGPMAEALAL